MLYLIHYYIYITIINALGKLRKYFHETFKHWLEVFQLPFKETGKPFLKCYKEYIVKYFAYGVGTLAAHSEH